MQYYPNYEYRFIGPIIPFVGGLLIGGLFAPSKGPLYPSNNQPTPIYYQPVQYYPVAQNGYPYTYPSNLYNIPSNTTSNINYKYPYQTLNSKSYQTINNPYHPTL